MQSAIIRFLDNEYRVIVAFITIFGFGVGFGVWSSGLFDRQPESETPNVCTEAECESVLTPLRVANEELEANLQAERARVATLENNDIQADDATILSGSAGQSLEAGGVELSVRRCTTDQFLVCTLQARSVSGEVRVCMFASSDNGVRGSSLSRGFFDAPIGATGITAVGVSSNRHVCQTVDAAYGIPFVVAFDHGETANVTSAQIEFAMGANSDEIDRRFRFHNVISGYDYSRAGGNSP